MTLAQVVRGRVAAVPAAGTARLVVRWDRETGWAHVAIAEPGADSARFVGFHRFAEGRAEAVIAELTGAGCVTASAPRLDDELMEIDAVLTLGELSTDALR